MTKLSASLLAPENFPGAVQDCKQIVEAELRQKNLAIRGIFKLLLRAKPDLLERGMRALLPDFARALDPIHEEYERSGAASFVAFADTNQQRIADNLLAVADRRVAGINNKAIRGGYTKLRGRAGNEVIKALPRIAGLVDRYAGNAKPKGQTAELKA